MQATSKILVIGPAWVGDMMMAQVLFRLLRQQNPTVEIHVLAPEWSQALLSRMPEVARSIVLPFDHGALQLFKRYQFAKTLRAEKYTQAIVLPNSWKSAFIPFCAAIPKRTGWRGEFRFGLLNDIRYLNKKKLPMMVQRFAALAYPKNIVLPADLPTPQLQVALDNKSFVLKKYHVKTDRRILALCPGAEYGSSKRWPANYYAQVANQKLAEGWQVWLFGSKNDLSIAEEIQQFTAHRCDNFIGKTILSDAVDLLSLADCVITNDSGLMHIATALDRFVIALYGSTSTQFTPPLSDKAKIVQLNLDCQPCFQRECPLKHHHCMTQLLPEKVLALF